MGLVRTPSRAELRARRTEMRPPMRPPVREEDGEEKAAVLKALMSPEPRTSPLSEDFKKRIERGLREVAKRDFVDVSIVPMLPGSRAIEEELEGLLRADKSPKLAARQCNTVYAAYERAYAAGVERRAGRQHEYDGCAVSPEQLAFVEAIRAHWEAHGRGPKALELAEAVGLHGATEESGRVAVNSKLGMLRERGSVLFDKENGFSLRDLSVPREVLVAKNPEPAKETIAARALRLFDERVTNEQKAPPAPKEIDMTLSADDGRHRPLPKGARLAQVLETLVAKPVSAIDLGKVLGITSANATAALRRLRKKGQVDQVGDGTWRLIEGAATSTPAPAKVVRHVRTVHALPATANVRVVAPSEVGLTGEVILGASTPITRPLLEKRATLVRELAAIDEALTILRRLG